MVGIAYLSPMKIGIDLMGGDFAPAAALQGIERFISQSQQTVWGIGEELVVKPLLSDTLNSSPFFRFVNADSTIGYHEHPTKAFKEKTKSSIAIGYHLLASGEIDAFISAGNTGAMLVGAMLFIKPIQGVLRPTLATILPKLNGGTGLLSDVGLNTDCKPEYLEQFAILASIYAKNMYGVASPKVALLNLGEEEGKGNALAQATYPLLKQNSQLQFVGNVEGRDFFNDKADVIVCDGFTGNVVLKLAETLYEVAEARGVANDAYFKRFHYEEYGGTPILGINKPVIIGHGISSERAFVNMLEEAGKMVQTELITQLKQAFV